MSTPVKIWSRFTRNQNGKELKLRIQELSTNDLEDIFSFMFKYFVPEEPFHKAAKVALRPEALEEYKEGFSMNVTKTKYQIDACCLEDGAEELRIVGLSLMVLENKGHDTENTEVETIKSIIKSEEIKTLLNIATTAEKKCDVFEELNLDSCYKGRGVAVHKDYRGLGIAGELLKARSSACIERGVPMTCAWMTSTGTQKAAAKLGWKTLCELQFKDFGEEMRVEFDPEPPSCKLMVYVV